MMLRLVLNVVPHAFDLQFTNTKSGVAPLPAEVSAEGPSPLRRVGFELLKEIGHSDSWMEFREDVDVILNSTDLQANALQSTNSPAEVFIKLRLKGFID